MAKARRPGDPNSRGVSERAVVKESSVHGRGLFATRRLRKEAFIATFEGTLTTRDGTHVLWVLAEDGSEYGIRGENELRFLNHSSRPNAEFRGADLYAVRNIQPGDEIKIHYGDDWDDVD
jgi:SET domain-containing protein